MYSVHLFDKASRVFSDQTAVAHVLKYLAGEGITLRFQFFQIGRKLFVYSPFDPIPDMHISVSENTVIGLLADQALILVLPAFPAGLGVEDPVSFVKPHTAKAACFLLPALRQVPL